MTRECGDCQLCCKLVPVRSLNKKAGVRCQHQRVHKGCMVHAKLWSVAPECALWNCRWLGNDDMDELRRPDRSHYVVDIMPDFVKVRDDRGNVTEVLACAQIWIDPDYPDAHRDPALRAWLIRKNLSGLVRYNNERAITLIPPHRMETGAWFEKHSNLQENVHSTAEIWEALGGAA